MSRSQQSPRPLRYLPQPPSQPSAARGFPKLSAAWGAGGNRQFARPGPRKSVCTHHLDGVDVEMVSSSSLGDDGRLRVWLAGKFFAGLGRAAPSQSDCGQPGEIILRSSQSRAPLLPRPAKAPSSARRGYLGTGPTLVLKFFNFFCSSKSSLGRPHQLQLQHSTTPLFTTGIDILPRCSYAEV